MIKMKIKDLRAWNGKKVLVKLRNNSKLEGFLSIKDNILYIFDAEHHAVALLPQEIVQITEAVK